LVLIDRCFTSLKTNYVGTDNEMVGALATGHLIEIGCKRIAHLRGPEISTGIDRMKGYLDTLAKHGMKPSGGYVSAPKMADVQSMQSGQQMMEQILKLEPYPDGVFAFNDAMAIGAMHAIFDAGLRIPEDIAVIGCSNLHYGAELRIPLSSIDQQVEKIGEQTARLTLSLLASKTPCRKKNVIIQPQLVVRASTKRQR
jgi:LacI family transcriptional regulator